MNLDWAMERLRQLRTEYEAGQAQLAELEERRRLMRDSLLRIGGAIQVLEEMIEESGAFAVNATEEPPIAVN
jgi:hypothetical protein